MLNAVDLLRKGYFRGVAQQFSTRTFAEAIDEDPEAFHVGKDWTECSAHILVRPDGRRRPLGIPNPRAYLKLSRVLEAHWESIEEHLQAQGTSISRPALREDGERAIEPRYRFGDRPRLRPRLWRGCRYLLNTDVSQFYKSLYTHSVSWALYGKEYAKAHKKDRRDRGAPRNMPGVRPLESPSGQTALS